MKTMKEKVEAFFSPSLTLWYGGWGSGDTVGKLGPYWHADSLKDRSIFQQFLTEAGILNGTRCTTEQLDAVGRAASEHGYSIETRNFPEEIVNA